MGHLTYLALLAGCLVVTAPLELVLRVRVYARWRRFLVAVVPEFVVFVGWTLYAIARRHWSYDGGQITGLRFPGGIPLEGLEIKDEAVSKLLEVDPEDWRQQLPQMHEHYARFGDRLPKEMRTQLEALERRLGC